MKEKILELKVDTTQVLKDNLDAVYLTEHDADQILSLMREEIKKSLLTDEEIGDMWQNWIATDEPSFEDAKKLATTRLKTIAQAQLDKVLKIVEEK